MIVEEAEAEAEAHADEDMNTTQEEDIDMTSISETTSTIRPYIPPKIQIPVATIPTIIPSVTPSGDAMDAMYAGIRLLAPAENTMPYRMPPASSHHAYHIWQQAGLPMYAVERLIEIKLIEWASQYAQLEISGHDIVSVRYQTSTDCLYFCSWRVFLRWMICACFPR